MVESYPDAKKLYVYTDWLLVRRLAWELERGWGGARVRDAGQLDDGRFALALWSRGATSLLCVDVFAPTPVITIEDGDLPVKAEPGFVRAAGAALRGTTLLAVRSRAGDRLVRVDFGSRSRFGVEDRYSLICELVPRFGNIVLVKDLASAQEPTIVAAAKEFEGGGNARRSIRAGYPYEPPPLRPGKASPLLADEIAANIAQNFPTDDLHVYRRSGELVQAHLVELPSTRRLEHARSDSLLDLLAEARRTHAHAAQSDRIAARRRALERALGERERKARAEVAAVDARLQTVQNRDALRAEGESIYARLHELDGRTRDDAKERAAQLFTSYKKAAHAGAHLERRRREVAQTLEGLAELRWELERAADADLDDVAQAVNAHVPQRGTSATSRTRKRKPLQYRTLAGSRIYVGRTPVENADLTFRLARPDDLWFHVQKQPGAHVILQRDDKAPAPQSDVLAAAGLAALHSKGKNSPKVTVDYTHRKFVRKQPSAAPGLVFYTHPTSVHVEPRVAADLSVS